MYLLLTRIISFPILLDVLKILGRIGTTSAKQMAKSILEMQNPDLQDNYIELANTNSAALTDVQVAILFHWVRHINDPEYEWVPDKYKINMPQYKGVKD